MDIRKIKKLIELLEGSDVNEIEISEGEGSVRINRGNSFAQNVQYTVAPQTVPAAQAPVPQARVSPAPRSNTRKRIWCVSIICINPAFTR